MSPKIQQFESLATCSKQQPPPSSTSDFQWIHVSERNMWRIHVAIGDMDVSEGYMYPSATCGGYMLPFATWMYPTDTCIRARHVADTCRHWRHGCIRRIHVSQRDMWRIHVAIGDMDVSKGYMHPSATCIRYMYLVDGNLYAYVAY